MFGFFKPRNGDPHLDADTVRRLEEIDIHQRESGDVVTGLGRGFYFISWEALADRLQRDLRLSPEQAIEAARFLRIQHQNRARQRRREERGPNWAESWRDGGF
ncbi:MAG: hypothetical protein LPK43_03855 [Gammaproteobacteria bacterium]|nr:hypothetical protein [Gammaproteobacteria bacterium]